MRVLDGAEADEVRVGRISLIGRFAKWITLFPSRVPISHFLCTAAPLLSGDGEVQAGFLFLYKKISSEKTSVILCDLLLYPQDINRADGMKSLGILIT